MIDTLTLLLLCLFAFAAGFVDAIAGGGGLIQTPAALVLLPQLPVATILGTMKLPSFTGTGLALMQYMKKVTIIWREAAVMCIIAFGAAFFGSELLTRVDNRFMKPVIFCMLVIVAVYTYTKKSFGQEEKKPVSVRKERMYAILISLVIGFYDGFIGPGAGSFLVLAFITFLGLDFLHASANAKIVNLATNSGSLVLFIIKGSIIWTLAIPMAICNGLGGVVGARVAILRGNRFIRIFFLIIVTGTLVRIGYDIFLTLLYPPNLR